MKTHIPQPSRMQKSKRVIATLALGILPLATIGNSAHAGMINSQSVIQHQQLQLDRQALISMVHEQGVQEQLIAQGISQEQAEQRINSMTAEELSAFNEALNNAPAGGSILGVAATLFIVFVITDAFCATDLFTFVHCIND